MKTFLLPLFFLVAINSSVFADVGDKKDIVDKASPNSYVKVECDGVDVLPPLYDRGLQAPGLLSFDLSTKVLTVRRIERDYSTGRNRAFLYATIPLGKYKNCSFYGGDLGLDTTYD